MGFRGVLFAGALALGLWAAGPALAASAPEPAARPDPTAIRPDPAVVQGTLPNGLRYWIMRNAIPAGAMSIRLVFDIGSYDEADEEAEAAHFVEHMAFRNPLTFSGEDVSEAFESMGVGFGRDQNAVTGLYTTTYRLDLPRSDGPILELSFRWLRDIADGINFNQATVDAERGVILAERQSHLGAATTTFEQVNDFEAPGLRTTARLKSTPEPIIAALNAGRLSAFYQRWYRPENARLVVVGDQPPEVMIERIRQSFGSWRAQGPKTPRRPFGAPDAHRGLDVLSLPAATMASRLEVCRISSADPWVSSAAARLRAASARAAWANVLAQRLTTAVNSPGAPFIAAQVQAEDQWRELKSICLAATFGRDAWAPALAAVQAELRRLETYGPSQEELDGAVDEMRSVLRGAASQARTRRSADLAALISTRTQLGEAVVTPAEAFRDYDTTAETLTPAEVKAAFQNDWSGGGPLVTVLSPNPPSTDEIRRAWTSGEAAPAPGALKSADAPVWAYRDFGKPGHVVSREPHLGPGFVRLRFANGLVLNFKQTDFSADSVSVRVRFGAGRREVANADYIAAVFGAELFAAGGLGKHSYAEIVRMFRDNDWAADLTMGEEGFTLSAKTTRGGLDDQLQLLAAYLTDPGFRPEIDARLKVGIEAAYRGLKANMALSLSRAVTEAVAPDSPAKLPPEAQLESLPMADFERILKPALTSDPLELTVVGDVDEKALLDIVGRTLGALPPRPVVDHSHADTWFLRFPRTPPAMIRTTHEGSKDRALIGVVWPLYVASPQRRREEVALNLLDRAFQDRLRRRVRVELGKTYSPEVAVSMPDFADQGEMMALVEAAPADVDQVVDEIRKLSLKLAGGDLPDDEVEAARAPLVSSMQARAKDNASWAAGLNGSSGRDPDLVDYLNVPALVQSVTPAEVRKAAADWLAAAPIVVVATPEPAPAMAKP